MEDFIHKLHFDYPDLLFQPGDMFCWSPKQKCVVYEPYNDRPAALWSLLHEVSHASLNHLDYKSDFELLSLEVAAWQTARELAKTYTIEIPEDHIQNCLDTYREWLYQRSTCPVCGTQSLQSNSTRYECFNCRAAWKVSTSRFCRPYRLHNASIQIEKPPMLHAQTTFL